MPRTLRVATTREERSGSKSWAGLHHLALTTCLSIRYISGKRVAIARPACLHTSGRTRALCLLELVPANLSPDCTMALTTKIYYLERLELYETEKPYMLAFTPPGTVIPKTNHFYVPYEVPVSDAQPWKHKFSLDVHGFQFNEWATDLSADDFDDDDVVKSKYYPEIVEHMWRQFPESSQIHVLTHLVSLPAPRRMRSAS